MRARNSYPISTSCMVCLLNNKCTNNKVITITRSKFKGEENQGFLIHNDNKLFFEKTVKIIHKFATDILKTTHNYFSLYSIVSILIHFCKMF